jgi:putative nucleotidyltransferase with HDIG domain
MDQSVEVRRRIFKIERLAAMPQVVWRLVEALGDERTDAIALQGIIESDQALTSKVLSLANSAYYGFPTKITTVQRAVVAIGFQELQLLALSTGLTEVFDLSQAPPGFDAEGLWLHCLGVSCVAKLLAQEVGQVAPSEVMIAALLHDLGKLVLATQLTEEFAGVLERMNQGLPYHLAEEQAGLPHTLVGYWLAKRWGLPEVHCEAVRYHHAPNPSSPYFMTVCLVALADRLAKSLGLGLALEAGPLDLPQAMSAAGLKVEMVRKAAAKAKDQAPQLLDSWRQLTAKGA